MNAICLGGILAPLVHRGSPDALRPRLPNLVNRLRDPETPSVLTMGVTGVDKGRTGQPPVIRPKAS